MKGEKKNEKEIINHDTKPKTSRFFKRKIFEQIKSITHRAQKKRGGFKKGIEKPTVKKCVICISYFPWNVIMGRVSCSISLNHLLPLYYNKIINKD